MREIRRLTLLALMALTSCSACDDDRAPTARPPPPTVTPVPAPAGLAADIQIPRPKALLGALRESAGGSALFVPRTVGGLTASLLGLPIQIAELVDEQLPIVGAVAVHDKHATQVAFAVHVSDTARLKTFVAHGRDAAFTATKKGDITWLAPKETARAPRVETAIALLDNYLLAGSDKAAVETLGPYLTRTLAAKAPPKSDAHVTLTAQALDPLKKGLEALPQLDVPKAIAAWLPAGDVADTAAALLEGAGAGTIDLLLDDSRLTLEARLKRDGPSRPSVAPKSVLDLPEDVVATIVWAEQPSERAKQAAERAAALRKTLGEGGDDAAEATLREALIEVAHGMGEHLTLGIRCTGVGFTGLARGEVADASRLSKGLAALADLREHPAVVAHLEEADLTLSFEKRRLELVPFDLFRLRLEPKKDKSGPFSEIDFLYGLDDDHFVAAAGEETVETTKRLVRSDIAPTLATREAMAEAVGRLPNRVWLAAVVDAQGLHACSLGKPGGRATPVVFSVGPADGGLGLRFEMPRLLLRLVADAL